MWWFQSKRKRAINATMDRIASEVATFPLPPTTYEVAVMLRREMAAQGIALDLDKASKVVQRRRRRSYPR